MKLNNRWCSPQMEPQEDLPDIDVDALITKRVKWPTVENLRARHLNQKIITLWSANGNAQKTNTAIDDLLQKLGTFKRIKNE